jgi:hypothetical protein
MSMAQLAAGRCLCVLHRARGGGGGGGLGRGAGREGSVSSSGRRGAWAKGVVLIGGDVGRQRLTRGGGNSSWVSEQVSTYTWVVARDRGG